LKGELSKYFIMKNLKLEKKLFTWWLSMIRRMENFGYLKKDMFKYI
jgi:hypothetical protein